MRVIILIVVALILLLGGGGAAWWFLLGPGAEQTSDLIAEINKPDPIFIPVDPPLVISLIQGGEVTHHVTMQVTLLLGDDTEVEETTRRMPLLRDALLTEMHSLFALRLVRNAGFESGLVKQRLLEVCGRQLGKGVVTEILLREVERSQPHQS
ncbi:MAG: flagellar basal body-associated protein FliL [Kiloniellaceae bacterium]